MTKADIMKEYDFVILMPPEELYRELTEEEARDFIDCAAKIIQAFRVSAEQGDEQYEGIY